MFKSIISDDTSFELKFLTSDLPPLSVFLFLPVYHSIVTDIQLMCVFNAVGKFNQLVYQYPIRIPERFSLVIRSLLTQEGICFTLQPDFKFLEVRDCLSVLFFQFNICVSVKYVKLGMKPLFSRTIKCI